MKTTTKGPVKLRKIIVKHCLQCCHCKTFDNFSKTYCGRGMETLSDKRVLVDDTDICNAYEVMYREKPISKKVLATNKKYKEWKTKLDTYAYVAKSRGFCDQCQYPWYDGLCECGNFENPNVKEALKLALTHQEWW
jgi:hypothetical protein